MKKPDDVLIGVFLKTESKYNNKLTAESCFHLHKTLDSNLSKKSKVPSRQLKSGKVFKIVTKPI